MSSHIHRIVASENEWGSFVALEQGGSYEPGNVGSIMQRAPGGILRLGDFYENGARGYTDIGGHPEYATGECFLDEIVAQEIAGEEIVYASFEQAKNEGRIHDFQLNKRVLDEHGTVWGYHENFASPANKISIDAKTLALLGLFQATSNAWAGAGFVYRDKEGATKFGIAQKASHLTIDAAEGTTNSTKPLINLRNQPHTDGKWLRIHTVCRDPNMSPWAIRMRFTTTSLVLRLIENGYRLRPELTPRMSLLDLAIQVAYDPSMKPIEMEEGGRKRPADIERMIIEDVRELSKTVEIPKEELALIDEWEAANDDLATEPMRLQNRSDWAGKKMRLDKYADRHGLDPRNPATFKELVKKDRQWDLNGPKSAGLAMRGTTEWQKWMPPREDIEAAKTTPSAHTRAHIRGNFVREVARRKRSGSVDWDYIAIGSDKATMASPYTTRHKKAARLITAVSGRSVL